jgi:uncharacterized protein (UPF0332 family)
MEYQDRNALNRDLVRFKLTQAHDALDGVRSVLAAHMDLDFAANGIFYAMFYAVLALLQKRKIPASTQNVTLSLFDREFVQTGVFDWHYSEAVHRAFELRKTCSCEERKTVTRKDVDDLLPLAEEFLKKVEAIIDRV